jgi:hypothetical protein
VSGPITPERLAAATEIVALSGWRWTRGLHSVRGLVVRVDPDGVPVVRTLQDEQILEIRWDDQMVQRNGALLPDVDDELLPGWLLHLLRERCGGRSHVDCHSGGWAAWVPAGVALAGPAPAPPGATWQLAGFGPTELHALVAALRRAG